MAFGASGGRLQSQYSQFGRNANISLPLNQSPGQHFNGNDSLITDTNQQCVIQVLFPSPRLADNELSRVIKSLCYQLVRAQDVCRDERRIKAQSRSSHRY